MRYCVYGLGAIGGQIAARLAHTGHDIFGLARQRTVDAITEHGLRLHEPDGTSSVTPLRVTSDVSEVANADVVILALKATALPSVAAELTSAVAPDTVVLTAMNGLPWWFPDGIDLPGKPAVSTTDAALQQVLPAGQVIGCAVHATARTEGPGHIVLTSGNRLVIGPATWEGPAAHRCADVATDLRRAGFDVEESSDVREAIWLKLWGNLINPASLITRSPVDRIVDDPLVVELLTACMDEAKQVGERLGFTVPVTPAERLELTRKLGSFTTSMHQDAVSGREVELDALLGAVHRLGQATGIATPYLSALLGLSRLHAEAHGLLGSTV